MMDGIPFLTGRLLLAVPGIGDPRFDRAVIAMCSHDAGGAFGIGIGTITPEITLHGLLSQFEIETDSVPDVPIHVGGPVEPQRGFVIHSRDWSGQGTIDVAGRWALSSTIDALRVLGRNEGPRQWLVALGYAGWGEGQLDEEMHRHGWQVGDASDTLIFGTQAGERWSAAYRAIGFDPALLASQSGHA
jgi:putative transcriptional regulator